ncbi:hypothetical protein Tco_0475161 [Tanacetum coccineum]
MSLDNASSVVTYTSISSDSDGPSWGIQLMNAELENQIHVYVLEPVYPEYHVPSNNDIQIEINLMPLMLHHQPYRQATLLKESSDDEEEEEEHLAHVVALLAIDPVPSAEETEPFEIDDSAATPPPPPAYRTTSKMLFSLPTPPPSPLTLLSSPLPHIPSPPTYHPLPLPAPSTSRIADILEAELPPQKRLLITPPTPRFEIGESSITTAARQPRSTMAHRIYYSFVDTLDASIHSSEQRAMAAIELVNLRVNYHATIHRRESEEFETCYQDAQDDRAALRDEGRYIEEVYRHEWQRQDADNRATRHIMRIQVLEAEAYVDTLEETVMLCSSWIMSPRRARATAATNTANAPMSAAAIN